MPHWLEPWDLLVGIKEPDKALLQKELCIYPSMVFIYSKVKESSRIINLRTINNHNNETTNDQNHQHVNHQEIDEIRLQKHHLIVWQHIMCRFYDTPFGNTNTPACMRRIVLQCESTTSNKIFSATMQKNNNRRILNKAVQSFPAAFISISTPSLLQTWSKYGAV